MARDTKELLVFIGSPADLGEERVAIYELESRLNAAFSDVGVRIRVVGWEIVAPGYGRPQGLINPLVEQCDIFIGLLNRRWGSNTGRASSGFQEEFDIALSRRQKSLDPKIGIFFAELTPDAIVDAGPQLRRVLKFQDRVRAEHLVLYKIFTNPDHLTAEIITFLIPMIMELGQHSDQSSSSSPGPQGADGQAAIGPNPSERGTSLHTGDYSAERPEGSGADTDPLDPAQRQAVNAFNSTSRNFTNPESREETGRAWDRVQLLANAFGIDRQQLSPHLLNRLFLRRDEIFLTRGEAHAWFRTYFWDYYRWPPSQRTVPMWTMFSGPSFQPEGVMLDVCEYMLHDDASIAPGVLRLAVRHNILLPLLWPSTRVPSMDSDRPINGLASGEGLPEVNHWVTLFEGQRSASNVIPTLNYFAAFSDEGDGTLISELMAHVGLPASVRTGLHAILQAHQGDPEPLVEVVKSLDAGDGPMSMLLVNCVANLSDSSLLKLASLNGALLPGASVRRLAAVSSLTEEKLAAIFRVKDRDALSILAAREDLTGELLPRILGAAQNVDRFGLESFIVSVLAQAMPTEELDVLNSKESQQDTLPWQALGLKSPRDYAGQAREVLDGTSSLIARRVSMLDAELPVLVEYLEHSTKGGACRILARLTDVSIEDLLRVHRVLMEGNVFSREAALDALLKMSEKCPPDKWLSHGRPKTRLRITIPQETWVEPHVERIIGSPLAGLVAVQWQNSELSFCRNAAIAVSSVDPSRSDASLEEDLYSSDAGKRYASLGQLLERWDHDALLELMTRYTKSESTYWYNVVATLDEVLFFGHRNGPKSIRLGD